VRVAEVVSTGVPLITVVDVVMKVPLQAVFGIRNGNEMESAVPALIVNGGVVNMTVSEFAQDLGPCGNNFLDHKT
jgi:hypothetical protein